MAKEEWKVLEGRKASIQTEDESFADVMVLETVRGGKVKIRYHAEEGEVPYEEIVPLKFLEKPLASDVNDRFEYFRELVVLVLDGKVCSLVVTGAGGIGKTHTINEVIELEALRDFDDIPADNPDINKETIKDYYDFVRIKGYTTPRALFDTLREHSDKRVIMDDCDSALNDVNALNIIKSAVDTYERRIVQWRTAREQASFEFTGSLIFLSNKHQASVSQAVISRSIVVDLHMTQEEKIDRMGHLLPHLTCVKLEMSDRMDVLKLIDKYKFTLKDLNLRTLMKALIVFENTKNIDIVRYQILNG